MSREPGMETCKHCGAIDRPLLTQGTGPHAIRASCQHCGKFLRWVSILSPSERLARRLKHQAQALARRPASAMQLSFLEALGDKAAPPANAAEASERIEELKTGKRS